MSAAKDPSSDPSMDDILASIRKIISDDEARAQVSGQKSGASSPHAPGGPPPPRQPSPRDDVLLLTDLVEEPTKGQGTAPGAQPGPSPRIDPVKAAEMPQPSVETPADGSLVGPGVAGVATTAFARLNQAVQDSVPPPAAPDPGPALGNGGKTIEDLVKEMLRPMLKEWLDKNLPPMVERYVEREISRLTRR